MSWHSNNHKQLVTFKIIFKSMLPYIIQRVLELFDDTSYIYIHRLSVPFSEKASLSINKSVDEKSINEIIDIIWRFQLSSRQKTQK